LSHLEGPEESLFFAGSSADAKRREFIEYEF